MKNFLSILSICLLSCLTPQHLSSQSNMRVVRFDFYGDSIRLNIDIPAPVQINDNNLPVSENIIKQYFEAINATAYTALTDALLLFKEQYKLDDWLYYQLIRKTVQSISPKEDNYERYTVYKWFLLLKSGYGATLKIGNDRLMFYVQTDEEIFNLPYYLRNGKQYVCLNYHDYKPGAQDKNFLSEINWIPQDGKKPFTYKVTQLPNFRSADYIEKDLRFNYYQDEYQFKVKLNPQIKSIFANYPVVSYENFFNIPLSAETYQSLIPLLKKNIKGMSTKNGIDFLMRFTRYAFLFETDLKNFGQEKRLSPEQTLLFDQSDCEDRAALFFCLVKEIYNLPMIVLSYPKHITIAVKFDKPIGKPILYQGEKYTMVEATPQALDLNIGSGIPTLKNTPFEVVYAYYPVHNK